MEPLTLTASPLDELRAAALAAGQATDRGSYLQQAVEQLARLVGGTRCSILVLRSGRLYHGGSVGLPEPYLDAIDGTQIGPDVGTCGAAAATGRPVVTLDIETDPRWDGWREVARAAGLRSCWSVPLTTADGSVAGTFATYSAEPFEPSEAQLELARAHASLVALALERLRREERLSESHEAVVLALSSALDVRDEYTAAHSTETAALAVRVGSRLGLSGADLRRLEQAAVLHDIGKIGIPTEVLRAARPLTDQEWELVRQHPLIGEQILRQVPFLAEVARAVRSEHERWDGRGYPDGLRGDAIPLASRIVFVCDAWHAMTSDRPYRPALSRSHAEAELRAGAGSQFDPRVVECLLDVLGLEPAAPETGGHGEDEARAALLGSLARAAGAEDLLVFRKVAPRRFCHLGGVGRGESWAGNVELEHGSDEPVARALSSGEPVALSFEGAGRVVGPYWARSALAIPCGPDAVVVLGSSTGSLDRAPDDELRALAGRAAEAIEGVAPAKRLADELEVLEARRAIASISGDSLEETLGQLANAAAAALSCEFGAVVAFGPDHEPRLGFAERGFAPAEPDAVADLVVPFITGGVELPLLAQDAGEGDGPARRLGELGAASVHALAVGDPPLAAVVLVHAHRAPRGFTLLCRRVARAVAEGSEAVIRRAIVQEELADESARLSQRARTDALTGLASRTAWEHALRREEANRRRSGAPAAVAVLDLDGQAAAGEHLQACAEELCAAARATDLVARVAERRFTVLLRYTEEAAARAWLRGVQAALARRSDRAAIHLAVTAGAAAAPPHASLSAALEAAGEAAAVDGSR